MPKSLEKMRLVKERIFHAAMELFREKGFENTSVEEITRKAGVSKGTFFTHFPTKNSVFSAVGKILVDYVLEDAEAVLKPEKPVLEIMRDSIGRISAWCTENRVLMQQVMASGMYRPAMSSRSTSNRVATVGMITGLLGAGVEKGEISGRISLENAALVILGTCFTVIYDWIEADEWPLQDKLNECIDLIFQGLRP